MTPQELSATKPAKRKLTFQQKVTWAIVGALVGAVLTVAYFMMKGPTDEDDRPPIIVRNGSVHLEAALSGNTEGRGKFHKDPNKNVWLHKHDAGGPQKFGVVVSGVDTSKGNCSTSAYFSAEGVRLLTIEYSRTKDTEEDEEDLDDREILIDRAQGHLQITPDPGAVGKTPTDYQIDFDSVEGAKLKSVTIAFKKKQNDSSDTLIRCDFGGTVVPEIVILQRK